MIDIQIKTAYQIKNTSKSHVSVLRESAPGKKEGLLLEAELLDEAAVGALVGALQVLQVCASVRNEAKEAAARVFVLAILVQMGRKLGDAARKYSDLHLR